jgi:fatty-acyl-CoA synthase
LRRDGSGNYWFLERLGDSFRFKGENVSAWDVERALGSAPGVGAVSAVGVEVPGIDGRPGLAVIVPDGDLDLGALARAASALPPPARPCFVRVASALELGASLKIKKRDLARQGVDPRRVPDPLYFRAGDGYERLTPAAFARLAGGEIRF